MMGVLFRLVLIVFITIWAFVRAQEVQPVSTRKKRFLSFPKGTVIQLVYCYLMSAIGTEGIFTVGVTLGTNWDVPVDLDKLMFEEHQKILANRRDRRSLYPRIEYVFNQLGIDGKSCVKRLLCNSRTGYGIRKKLTFIEEIIRIIFLYSHVVFYVGTQKRGGMGIGTVLSFILPNATKYPPYPSTLFEPIDEYDHMSSECADMNSFEGCM